MAFLPCGSQSVSSVEDLHDKMICAALPGPTISWLTPHLILFLWKTMLWTPATVLKEVWEQKLSEKCRQVTNERTIIHSGYYHCWLGAVCHVCIYWEHQHSFVTWHLLVINIYFSEGARWDLCLSGYQGQLQGLNVLLCFFDDRQNEAEGIKCCSRINCFLLYKYSKILHRNSKMRVCPRIV